MGYGIICVCTEISALNMGDVMCWRVSAGSCSLYVDSSRWLETLPMWLSERVGGQKRRRGRTEHRWHFQRCGLWQIKLVFLSVETTYISECVRLCLYQNPPIESKGLTKQEERQSLKRCHYNFSRTIIPGTYLFKGGAGGDHIKYDFIWFYFRWRRTKRCL